MKIRLWKTHHSPALLQDIERAWNSGDLVIVCSPMKTDLSFVEHLPASNDVSLHGDWAEESRRELEIQIAKKKSAPSYPTPPVLGVFTSGTVMGEPRLVLYSKAAIEASLTSILKMFNRKKIKSIFCYPQPFHTFGLLLGYVLSIKLKAKLTTPDGKYGREAHAIRESASEPGMLTLGAPVHFIDLIRYFSESKATPAETYSCIAGGAPVTTELWHAMRDTLGIESPSIGYGCTEASPGITHLPAGMAPLSNAEIGFPLDCLNVAKIETDGVRIAGASLCTAIIDADRITFPQELLIRDDVEVVEDRWVYRGRHDLVINRGGVKFALESIERSIGDELGIQVIATGAPDARLGQDLALTICRIDFESQTIEKLSQILERRYGLELNSENISTVIEFPINESAKIDRAAISARTSFRLPMSTTRLQAFLPHRAPMVWIDDVTSFDEELGECLITLKSDGLYMDGENLNPSSAIEFMAQAHGFLSAARAIANPNTSRTRISKAFLISVTNADVGDCANLKSGTRLHVQISGVRPLGPITLLDGEVLVDGKTSVARASLKVYAE